jgi:hypothetical protein
VASFLARSLGGPVSPHKAGELAAACVVERPDNPTFGFGALPDLAPAADPTRQPPHRRTPKQPPK